jgi:hypothetical protein
MLADACDAPPPPPTEAGLAKLPETAVAGDEASLNLLSGEPLSREPADANGAHGVGASGPAEADSVPGPTVTPLRTRTESSGLLGTSTRRLR